MFRESEVINLIVGLVFFLVFLGSYRTIWIPKRLFLWAGMFLILGAYVFTVLDGVLWPGLVGVLEHLCYALAGLSFAAGCWLTRGVQRRARKVQ